MKFITLTIVALFLISCGKKEDIEKRDKIIYSHSVEREEYYNTVIMQLRAIASEQIGQDPTYSFQKAMPPLDSIYNSYKLCLSQLEQTSRAKTPDFVEKQKIILKRLIVTLRESDSIQIRDYDILPDKIYKQCVREELGKHYSNAFQLRYGRIFRHEAL
ncbi:MAG: hypothetical protein EOP53_24055 [Sphingobacteriales bacterium]|nr:MAG: hypothetical protein EOP53_24055 [Sphingobacteriales bacterium]